MTSERQGLIIAAEAAEKLAAATGHPFPITTTTKVASWLFRQLPSRRALIKYHLRMGVRDVENIEHTNVPYNFDVSTLRHPTKFTAARLFIALGSQPNSGSSNTLASCNRPIADLIPFVEEIVSSDQTSPIKLLDIGSSAGKIMRFGYLDASNKARISSLLDEIRIKTDNREFENDAMDYYATVGDSSSPSAEKIGAKLSQFRLMRDVARFREDPSSGFNEGNVILALRHRAIDNAQYGVRAAARQLAYFGEFDEALSVVKRYKTTFQARQSVDPKSVAALYGVEPTADHDPHTSLGSVILSKAGVYLKMGHLSTGRERASYLRSAKKQLLLAEQLYRAPGRPWLHGLARLQSYATVAAFLDGNEKQTAAHARLAMSLYMVTNDELRVARIKKLKPCIDIHTKELTENIDGIMFLD